MRRVFAFFFVISLSLQLVPANSFALPSAFIIIRHGEKPDDKTSPELSEIGKERAEQLVQYFETNPQMVEIQKKLGKIRRFYGMAPHAADGTHRTIDTIAKTAKSYFKKKTLQERALQGLFKPKSVKGKKTYYNKYVHSGFEWGQEKEQIEQIVADATADGGPAVLCWEHAAIANLQRELGVKFPEEWPDDVFNRTLVIIPRLDKGVLKADQVYNLAQDLPVDLKIEKALIAKLASKGKTYHKVPSYYLGNVGHARQKKAGLDHGEVKAICEEQRPLDLAKSLFANPNVFRLSGIKPLKP